MSRPNRKHKSSESCVQVLAEEYYLARIRKNPCNPKYPMPKHKHIDTLYKREKTRNCLGERIDKIPF